MNATAIEPRRAPVPAKRHIERFDPERPSAAKMLFLCANRQALDMPLDGMNLGAQVRDQRLTLQDRPWAQAVLKHRGGLPYGGGGKARGTDRLRIREPILLPGLKWSSDMKRSCPN